VEQEAVVAWRMGLKTLLSSLPADYADAKRAADMLRQVFHEELAKAFAPRLNARLSQLPQATLEQCRDLASFCNSELDDLHLRIRCPRTGLGAILIVDTRSQEQDAPRFRLQTRGSRGDVARTYTSRELPVVELIEDSPRQLGHGRSGRGSGRGR